LPLIARTEAEKGKKKSEQKIIGNNKKGVKEEEHLLTRPKKG